MIKWMSRLKKLVVTGSLITQEEALVVLLTGLSSYRSSQLTDEQYHFLQQAVPATIPVLPSNFPYHRDFLTGRTSPSLFMASLRNAMQFILASVSTRFGHLLAKHLQPIFNSERKCVIVTGSCGIALWHAALPFLRLNKPDALLIIALGPVHLPTSQPFSYKMIRICGSRDWISRAMKTGKIDYSVNCGHLDYYTNVETQHLVKALCEEHFAEK